MSDSLLQKTEESIHSDCHLTIRELHKMILEVSKTMVREAMKTKLNYKKIVLLSAQILMGEHKKKWMDSVLMFLTNYGRGRRQVP